MKTLLIRYTMLALLFAGLTLSNYSASAQKTVIYLVRHAEKDTTKGNDPGLSKAGLQRAQDLMKLLKREKIAGVYVTNYQRTLLTAKPTADKFTTVPQVYTTIDRAAATKIYQSYVGKNILIVGHSNTIVPIIMAFCNIRPFTELADGDYDMLFKITIKNGKAELEISYYGVAHHESEIPEQYSSDLNNHYTAPIGRF